MKKCSNCEVNQAESKLVNGEDIENLCRPCCEERIYDMAICNSKLSIKNEGVKEGLNQLILI